MNITAGNGNGYVLDGKIVLPGTIHRKKQYFYDNDLILLQIFVLLYTGLSAGPECTKFYLFIP
jgi:hypothetical protein